MRRKRIEYALLIACIINNVLIGKQHDIPFCPQKRIVSAQPDTLFLKRITLYPFSMVHILLVPEMVCLVYHHCIALQMHPLCQCRALLIDGRHQNLQSHANTLPLLPAIIYL